MDSYSMLFGKVEWGWKRWHLGRRRQQASIEPSAIARTILPTVSFPISTIPPLLSLPYELREIIWRYVLAQPGRTSRSIHFSNPDLSYLLGYYPALLRVNHQILTEARHIWLSECEFRLNSVIPATYAQAKAQSACAKVVRDGSFGYIGGRRPRPPPLEVQVQKSSGNVYGRCMSTLAESERRRLGRIELSIYVYPRGYIRIEIPGAEERKADKSLVDWPGARLNFRVTSSREFEVPESHQLTSSGVADIKDWDSKRQQLCVVVEALNKSRLARWEILETTNLERFLEDLYLVLDCEGKKQWDRCYYARQA
ncbi:MAG: hypothetical protein M1820_002596 [Bogoriella megaspora]|nr:MAG: hypothetical protein M1820_002596 [Bogoriella megaspora]